MISKLIKAVLSVVTAFLIVSNVEVSLNSQADLIKSYIMGEVSLNPEALEILDKNNDGRISAADYVICKNAERQLK